MNEKFELINKLGNKKNVRKAYVRAKISVNLPSQIRALRLKQKMNQEDLAQEAEMKQPRISAMERPGATKFNLETLIRLAAAFKVGLIVKFAPFSEMLRWENEFSQDTFNVATIEEDFEFQREEQPAITSTTPFVQNIFSEAASVSLGISGSDIGKMKTIIPTGTRTGNPSDLPWLKTNKPERLGKEVKLNKKLSEIKQLPAF